ncbi:hypothetical protein A3I48_00745 [Candidatus Daviesbacteria bacterium RIFCSPLOWO2_02_FULL_36_7]|uniref:PIN domain-containing protein n=1 Tax=Candidatus Daviesbacteria bacterium RIFCSPLOWO2_02_FULL_36_7 TaxID=1797792 RepID=A0A1F5MHT8_9BACT|nr:MAG: hypothetical protein A3I48_00745 [Candidatus Daviesbacteria bacterium RIFCSPLOWO2_02_FULL_36_7]
MKKIILDTNGILRLFLDDIPKQADQVELLLKRAKKGEIKLIIPQIVVFEVNFALKKYYHFEKNSIIDKLKSLLSTDYLQVESREVFLATLTLYSTFNASFVDCFLLSLAQAEEGDLFTSDQKLNRD